MTAFRLAGAPITWGVCEAPGWGHQMRPERVLSEMADLGLAATEAGPEGFLPDDPDRLRSLLDRHGLELVGAFIPVVLHDAASWPGERDGAVERLRSLAAAGGEMAVVAAATGADGYEHSHDLDDAAWRRLARSLSELEEAAGDMGLALTVHPHQGTVIERPHQVDRLLSETEAALCLDTGHLVVGGGDPVELARRAGDRVRHLHLKDVDAALARRVQKGAIGYHAAVAAGLFRPLGEGDLDLDGLLAALDGFKGWLVLEQDTVLDDEPPAEGGPRQSAETSLRHLESMIGQSTGHNRTERGGTHAN